MIDKQLPKNQIFQDVQTKVSDVVLGKEKPVEETDPEYEKLKHYIFGLEDHLAETQKQAFRLVKRHRGNNFQVHTCINLKSAASFSPIFFAEPNFHSVFNFFFSLRVRSVIV